MPLRAAPRRRYQGLIRRRATAVRPATHAGAAGRYEGRTVRRRSLEYGGAVSRV